MYKNYTNKFGIPVRYIYKLLLIMRLTTVILIATLMQASAITYAQKVTLDQKDAKLQTVFNEIRKQTGYDFIYPETLLKQSLPVSVKIINASIDEALQSCFEGQPLTYTINDKIVIVSEKKPSFLVKITAIFDQIEVRGIVLDENGKALAGAIVGIKDSKRYVVTNKRGEFSLNDVNTAAILKISYIGYVTREIKAAPNLGRISLEISTSQLDEARIIAYGVESRRFSVGSTVTITAKEIAEQPVTNFVQALQGRVPGLAVTSSSGIPGAQTTMQIRGQNTLKNNTNTVSTIRPYDQPLIIIDGVPFAQQNNLINQVTTSMVVQGTNLTNQTPGFSALNGINPQDIESISFLKDADATSIYGTQGSNGVILVTTKKGSPGKSDFSVTLNTSINTSTKPIELLNTDQYLQLRKDAFAADGVTPTASNAPDLMVYDQHKYTNWYKGLYVRTPVNTNLYAKLSGGSANTTYYVSGGYTRTEYNFPGDFADNTYTLHSNIHNSSLNNKLLIDYTADLSYDRNNMGYYAAARDLLLPPNLPDLMDAKGNLVWNYKGVDLSQSQFEAYLKKSTVMGVYNYNNALRASYSIIRGLNIGALVGYNRNNVTERNLTPKISNSPQYGTPTGSAFFGNSTSQNLSVEPQIDYSSTIGKGTFSALLGGTYRKSLSDNTGITGTGYTNDNLLGTISGAAGVSAADGYGIRKYVAVSGRLGYVYDQKYIISLTGRRDGSSNFGPGRQFGNFGSVGLGWILSQESFFKPLTSVFSLAKISANYGTTGSDGIGPYQYQSFWAPIANATAFQGSTPYKPNNLYNPVYSWDNNKKLNVGLDLGFLNDRLLVNANYYMTRIGDQLTTYPLPAIAGITSVFENLNATVQNKGWELSIQSTNVRTKNFTWNSVFNTSANRNKLLAFPNLENSSYASLYKVGMPTTIAYLYRYKGINPTTGLYEFYTKDGGVTSAPSSAATGGDQVATTYNIPKFFGGLGNNFRYRQFSVAMFFQFSKQMARNWLYGVNSSTGGAPGVASNLPTVFLNNYWKNPGDTNALFQKLTQGYGAAYTAANAFANSTGAFSDDTYLRLKTLSVGYSLPPSVLKKLHMKSFQANLQTQNLLTFTNYKVGDPEQPGNIAVIPLQRIILCGLNITY